MYLAALATFALVLLELVESSFEATWVMTFDSNALTRWERTAHPTPDGTDCYVRPWHVPMVLVLLHGADPSVRGVRPLRCHCL